MYACQSRAVGRQLLLFLFLLFVLLPCGSCQMKTMPVSPSPQPPVHHPQAIAEQLFLSGDFENAMLEYEQTYETALSPEDRNHALYGLACTQMILARTEKQLVEAISNLQKWDAEKGAAPFKENRHLLVLALKQQSELLQELNQAGKERDTQRDLLIANQQLQLAQMASTVLKLQNQIKELEAIDENVQERRKPL